MTSGHLNGRAGAEPEAERLSAAWDDLVVGRPVEVDGDDLVAVARRLHAQSTVAREHPGFRADLRDTLVHAPSTTLPVASALTGASLAAPARRPLALRTATAVQRAGVRWLGLAATIALLLVTAAGGYLAGIGRPGNGDHGATMIAYQDASPTIASTPASTGSSFRCAFGAAEAYSSPYLPCPELQEAVASTEVRGTFSAVALAAASVQMQTWTVVGGATVSFRAPTFSVAGVAVDLVLDGAYVATFDAAVTVTPAYVPQVMIPNYEEVPAGEPVELTGGDIVSYEIGTKRSVTNALAGEPLTFKTVLVHDGDPSPGNLVEGSLDFRATVDGDGVLPMTVGEYGPLGPVLLLNYVRVFDEFPLPTEVGGLRVVMGPVAGSEDSTEVSGWMLWASTFRANA